MQGDDVDEFTDAVPTWWRSYGNKIAAWGVAAELLFVCSSNSAACERVFAVLHVTYGGNEQSALADRALMLKFNQRQIGANVRKSTLYTHHVYGHRRKGEQVIGIYLQLLQE